jgi:hypothetical protein
MKLIVIKLVGGKRSHSKSLIFSFFPDSDVPDARCKLEEVGTKIDWNQNNNFLSAIIVLAQQFTKRNFEASLSQSWILSASY